MDSRSKTQKTEDVFMDIEAQVLSLEYLVFAILITTHAAPQLLCACILLVIIPFSDKTLQVLHVGL